MNGNCQVKVSKPTCKEGIEIAVTDEYGCYTDDCICSSEFVYEYDGTDYCCSGMNDSEECCYAWHNGTVSKEDLKYENGTCLCARGSKDDDTCCTTEEVYADPSSCCSNMDETADCCFAWHKEKYDELNVELTASLFYENGKCNCVNGYDETSGFCCSGMNDSEACCYAWHDGIVSKEDLKYENGTCLCVHGSKDDKTCCTEDEVYDNPGSCCSTENSTATCCAATRLTQTAYSGHNETSIWNLVTYNEELKQCMCSGLIGVPVAVNGTTGELRCCDVVNEHQYTASSGVTHCCAWSAGHTDSWNNSEGCCYAYGNENNIAVNWSIAKTPDEGDEGKASCHCLYGSKAGGACCSADDFENNDEACLCSGLRRLYYRKSGDGLMPEALVSKILIKMGWGLDTYTVDDVIQKAKEYGGCGLPMEETENTVSPIEYCTDFNNYEISEGSGMKLCRNGEDTGQFASGSCTFLAGTKPTIHENDCRIENGKIANVISNNDDDGKGHPGTTYYCNVYAKFADGSFGDDLKGVTFHYMCCDENECAVVMAN